MLTLPPPVFQAASALQNPDELRSKLVDELRDKRAWIDQTIRIAQDAGDAQHTFMTSRLETLVQILEDKQDVCAAQLSLSLLLEECAEMRAAHALDGAG